MRLYRRDTASWILLPWEAHALYPNVRRKLDRAGTLALEDLTAAQAVAAVLNAVLADFGRATSIRIIASDPNRFAVAQKRQTAAKYPKPQRGKVDIGPALERGRLLVASGDA